jgi:ABC-type phosphonate transport system ATPase subunit
MERREVLLEVKDICKNFGTTVALNYISFEVAKGEIRGLIGEKWHRQIHGIVYYRRNAKRRFGKSILCR